MKESFLHFVWQYLHFNVKDLMTASGEELYIVKQGNYQHHAGPDFENSRIRIDGVTLAGNIEIHVKASEWYAHHHESDPAYNNVILHVVWENDREVRDSNGHLLPVLELKGRVHPDILHRYETLMAGRKDILCQDRLSEVPSIRLIEMIDRALSLRLKVKSENVRQIFEESGRDWEETAYRLLLRNFGFKVNSEPFHRLSEVLPYKLLKKHLDQPLQVEALLYGMAGFLKEGTDSHQQTLKSEFEFLASKYKLEEKTLQRQEWKFLRMRPANFPTTRIAQLSAFLSTVPNLFGYLTEQRSIAELKNQFSRQPGAYWQEHYDFGKLYKSNSTSQMGLKSVENICINTIVPLWVAYGHYLDQEQWMRQALDLLEEIKPEENHITDKWKKAGVAVCSAHDSQGLIMQHNEFCLNKKCLECAVGNAIIDQQ